MSTLTLIPATTYPTAGITVNGTGYGNRRNVTVSLDGVVKALVRSSKSGKFSTTITAPSVIGNHKVSAYSTGGSASATLTVNEIPAPPPDPDPVISNIHVSVTDTSATVSWDVSEVAQGWFEYGITTSYGSESTHETSFNYSHHIQTVSGLTASTVYHFKVHAVDQSSNTSTSADQSFTTSTGATPPPPPPPPPNPDPGTRPFAAPVTNRTVTVPSTITTGSGLSSWLAPQADGAIIEFPTNKTYTCDTGIKITNKNNLILHLNGATFNVTGPGNTPDSSPFCLRASSHIKIDGPATVNGGDTTPTVLGGYENAHVLATSGWGGGGASSYVEISGITASHIYGDFAYLEGINTSSSQPSSNIWVHGNTGTYIGRNAVSYINCTDVLIEYNNFDQIGMDVIDIEPNFTYEVVKRCIFRNNTVGKYAIMTAYEGWLLNTWNVPLVAPEDIIITNNTVTGNPSSANSGSRRGLHVNVDHAGRPQRITVTYNSTTQQTSSGPMRFINTDTVTVYGNNQPLDSGSIAVFSGCTNIDTTP